MIELDAIFFDVDGTLVDATRDIVNATNFMLRTLGHKEKPYKEIVSHIGTGVSDLIRKSLEVSSRDPLVKKGVELYGNYYVGHAVDEAILYPHVRDVLKHFKGKRKFVLTNRYKRFAEKVLEAFEIDKYFEAVIGGDDEECLKPMKCLIDRTFSKFSVDHKKAMIVGDMDIDVMTGKNSGVATCFVTYGLGKASDVMKLKPDYVIDDIAELKKFVM